MKYVGIIGNNSKVSTNRKLMHFIANHFADEADIELFEIRDMPAFYESDNQQAPESVQALIDAIEASDGVIISTPEYDHSIPSALKSVLEWLSWSSKALKSMPTMIVGASYGKLGTSRAQAHLRQILTSPYLRALVLPTEFLLGGSLGAFDEAGNLVDPVVQKKLESVFAEFITFTEIVDAIRFKAQTIPSNAEASASKKGVE